MVVGAIVGAFFGGAGAIPGALAGLAVAEGVGIGLAVSAGGELAASALKVIVDLFLVPQTPEEQDADYDQIGTSAIGLAVMVVMLALAWIAARIIGAIVQAVGKTRFGQGVRNAWNDLTQPGSRGNTLPDAPDAAGPRPDAPDAANPRPDAPDAAGPRTDAPNAPDAAGPRPDAPDAASPRPDAPDATSPRPDAPDAASPRPDAPDAAGPRPDAPDAAGPRPDAPDTTSPRPDAPDAAGPRPDAPDATGPRPDAPESTGPKADEDTPASTSPTEETPANQEPFGDETPTTEDLEVARSLCFPTGTLVSTPEGLRSIETMHGGDRIYAYDLERQCVVVDHVVSLIQSKTSTWVTLTITSETIRTTRGHPFWVTDAQGWIEATDLIPGMHVLLQDGRIVEIISIDVQELTETESAYNLHIERLNNYFVGQSHILVHNTIPPKDLTRLQRPGYRNYFLREGGPTGKIYYSGMFGPGDTPQHVQYRHQQNHDRFNPNNGDYFDLQPGERTYGEARLFEHRGAIDNGTVIGRDANTWRGNRQDPIQPKRLAVYEAYVKGCS